MMKIYNNNLTKNRTKKYKISNLKIYFLKKAYQKPAH